MNQLDWPLVARKLPPFLVAFITAELFFKFKSFALECVAFLALWFVLNRLVCLIVPEARSDRSWFA